VPGVNDPAVCRELAAALAREVSSPVRFMEVCGTHTTSVARHGLKSLFPPALGLVSGPGCPVCVTSPGQVQAVLDAAKRSGVILATFGDLVRVPGPQGSLEQARAKGADVRVVYSPTNALDLARNHPDKTAVFAGIGFETTAPAVALTLLQAKDEGIDNFLVLCLHKRIIPALKALADHPEARVDGFLLPGHVSVVLGAEAYEQADLGLPGVVAGFGAGDILLGLLLLARQANRGERRVENAYPRTVRTRGNTRAKEAMDRVFEPADAQWRGLGILRRSGLALREEFSGLDAEKRLGLTVPSLDEPPGCSCGRVLVGAMAPNQCALFETVCTPSSPVGPCMVSSEGACAAWALHHPLNPRKGHP